MIRSLTVALLFLAGCQKCVRGHDETYVIPGHYYTTYLHVRVGRTSANIPQQHWVPEQTGVRYMCDEYEASK